MIDPRDVLRCISYKDWCFHVADDGSWFQVRFVASGGEQHGRKWRLSPHMTRSEVAQTALLAVLAAEEHEAREQFLYRGVPVYGPHIDVETLAAELARDLDVREPERAA